MEKKIDVVGQMILSAIPIIVTPLYAFYRIKKLKKGIMVMIVTLAIISLDYIVHRFVAESEFLNLESFDQQIIKLAWYVTALIIAILFPMYFVRKWTIEYNED